MEQAKQYITHSFGSVTFETCGISLERRVGNVT
jgi:hypothetical protein